jgi:hypothetical protein
VRHQELRIYHLMGEREECEEEGLGTKPDIVINIELEKI